MSWLRKLVDRIIEPFLSPWAFTFTEEELTLTIEEYNEKYIAPYIKDCFRQWEERDRKALAMNPQNFRF